MIRCPGCSSIYDSDTDECWDCGEYLDKYCEMAGKNDKCLGQILSELDQFNAYTPDGQKAGRLCSCEDYPCCGH